MKVKVVSRKLIKPCTPTPPNLNKYKLSFVDERVPPINVGVVLFYPTSSNIRKHRLEESLAKILPEFYILAGRYVKNDYVVDCGDHGVEFIEAEAVEVELVDLLEIKEVLNDLLPSKFYLTDESSEDPLLSIQVTELKPCGGLVISVSVCHRIFDASSLGTFVAAWSNATNDNNHPIGIRPSFESPSLFPGTNPDQDSSPVRTTYDPNIVVKRFSFDKDAIAILRSKLSQGTKQSTRIPECVWAKHGGESRSCLMSQAVNMRSRTIPPLQKHSCGNLILLSPTPCFISPAETTNNNNNNNVVIGIERQLVDILGDALEKTIADCAEMFSPGRWRSVMMGPVEDMYGKLMSGEVSYSIMFSDWSKFGFYKADFGWGKPVGARIGTMTLENSVILLDNKEGDGIDAWVQLSRDDMPLFEQDHGIKLYTT
ncbi:PREDICTED: pelargonidin 3-O-(6-caffeoylglucoside) 5-O-(6-O-malonylglucoside) 4'''-malonyltransferase-like [Erythranthe guttata]|uniref:pelargonidin 3-O-(6-caffeoylglucoside) 5-O-(6-O-malonylglucoside) 4'''-malonyltransferase-like n=1 Tax=Erythranthe guttata TaxID=4155 RepID=UPI00064DE8AE|nr:PREDICTED: pelargonidin 3-O-(6-caffeoylglucoside) 5-O-(6-O-malonylglucoside) 4'''-malonyltransferase-like [Erythranthe guttata]|eukprot:XP_012845865.1 PREDICTED: pelargonidin 3-O-(6-caffeoylglucoside) 5-O-(6-O-malonylglucoside) 4'''-malonyltransferase-like [Erythranthe guttata]